MMPVLPSGRFVDIMAERARYHAVHDGLRIKQSSPHAHLYGLVDVLVEHTHHKGSTERRLKFSGHTLSDNRWLGKWAAQDRKFFLDWVREPNQVRIIEHARRRVLAEDELPRVKRFDYAARLYSYLRLRTEQLNLPRAKPKHWRQTLLNLCKDGVSQAELNWSGILGFLEGLEDHKTIDKTVITDAMDFTTLRPELSHEIVCAQGCTLPLREIVQKKKGYELQLAGLNVEDEDIGVVRLSSSEPSYKVGVIWPGGRASTQTWFVLGPYGQAITGGVPDNGTTFSDQHAAVEAARRHALRNNRAKCDLVNRAPYDYMTLQGGERYREWLVTLPDYTPTHFTQHYLERNVLMHIRTKVRETEDGKRVLFIEELQSDWHQALARKQTRGIPQAPFKNEWPTLALKLMVLHVVEEGLDGLAWADGRVHEMRYDKPLSPLVRLYDKTLIKAANALAKHWGVRVSPHVFNTQSPWLHAVRQKDAWRVEGGGGKFLTRARYTKLEAMQVIKRHSKPVKLSLPTLIISESMRDDIRAQGLALFGTKSVR
ncbi:hypothetical protein V5T82_12340 [Magnetovibrio sp. PR-2]|uniref:hypothetical protein n=1 Tax=Magnetovibrio sp. PR-2 TaxID=3120356 RepID=UPI002FCE0F46